jgi:membrane-bound lytic murein transglycosylase B
VRARPAVGLLALSLLAGGTTAVAAGGAERPAAAPAAPAARVLAPPSPALPGLPTTSIELAQVPVDSPEFDRAVERYAAVDGTHAEARARRHDLDHTTTVLQGRVLEMQAVRASALARAEGLRSRLRAIEGAIQELAVKSFVAGGEDERLNAALVSETPAVSDDDRRDVFAGLTMDVLLTERAAYRSRLEEATERADTAADELDAAGRALADLAKQRPGAVEAEVDTGAEVATERVAYEEARVLATVDGVEFPLVALDAYYRAAESVAEERPQCRVRWWGIAGISRVEGRHGTYGGTTLQPNGDTSKPIIGIQLNGSNATAVVGDSDGGALDGDPAFDRAVGPMQFIPQTWSRYQADGNEDGTISPFNLYDATLAAAKYLCTSSSGLDGDPGLRSAYFSYNHSLPYVDAVLGYARLYERQIEVPEPEG